MLTGDGAELRKVRGAFFTPSALCDYVAAWAIRTADDQILEPSCGEAAFLLSAGERLSQLQSDLLISTSSLHGIEVHDQSAQSARALMTAAGYTVDIQTADFLDTEPEPRFDAVIGNPPYVRYQDWTGDARIKARAAALRAGVPLTNLASSWAAFVVHASLFLKKGGRLGVVLPAELLTVNYAAEVRAFLMRRFGRVRLVLFQERVFPGVLEEVVLLLADGTGPTDHCELSQLQNLDELATFERSPLKWTPIPADAKWTPALIPADAIETFTAVTQGTDFTSLGTWGETTLGMVTGNNGFFALPADNARKWRLTRSDLVALSPPGSSHLRGLTFTRRAWQEMRENGAATWLFRPAGAPSAGARRYIEFGVEQGVHQAFKCRVRTPWWRVPYLRPADLLLTYMNADTPRLCTNRAGIHHLNSVHGLYVPNDLRQLAGDLLPIASLNTLTILGAEVTGRAYGGGMLKLEPREADDLPLPSPELVRRCQDHLRSLRPQLGTALRGGRMEDAIALVDGVLLVEALGLQRTVLKRLVGARKLLASRRQARGRPPRG